MSHNFSRILAAMLASVLAAGITAARAQNDTRAQNDDKVIVATVDQARLVKVPAGAETLVIGNPTIADVTLLRKNNMMILTPKAFGETNFIALDSNGEPVAESMIKVVGATDSLILQKGTERQSYSCAPACQPTERLGDDDKYLSAVAAQTQTHTQRLSSVGAPLNPGISR